MAVDDAVTDANYGPVPRAVAHGLRKRCGVKEGDHIAVACSGGADSVALLRALHLLARRRKWNLTLTVAHVQHHLRDEAEDDAAFVEQLAQTLGLAFERRDLALERGGPGNLEARARHERYEALTSIARSCGAGFVATAHHADDQLETQLMAMLRGTTARGLRGIAWRRWLAQDIALIRPMLGSTREQAKALLHQLHQPWHEDATNADRSRTRSRLRHEVLPVLRALRPSVARKSVELGDHMRTLVKDLDKHEGR